MKVCSCTAAEAITQLVDANTVGRVWYALTVAAEIVQEPTGLATTSAVVKEAVRYGSRTQPVNQDRSRTTTHAVERIIYLLAIRRKLVAATLIKEIAFRAANTLSH